MAARARIRRLPTHGKRDEPMKQSAEQSDFVRILKAPVPAVAGGHALRQPVPIDAIKRLTVVGAIDLRTVTGSSQANDAFSHLVFALCKSRRQYVDFSYAASRR